MKHNKSGEIIREVGKYMDNYIMPVLRHELHGMFKAYRKEQEELMESVWHVNEEYGAGHMTLAVCSTEDKAMRVLEWYKRPGVFICKQSVDTHTALSDRRRGERRKP